MILSCDSCTVRLGNLATETWEQDGRSPNILGEVTFCLSSSSPQVSPSSPLLICWTGQKKR
jgi:hypothetical protein